MEEMPPKAVSPDPAALIGRSWYMLVPVVALAIIIALSAGLWWRDKVLADEVLGRDFDHRSNAIQSEVFSRLNRLRDLLWAVRAEFSNTSEISPQQWRNFIERIEVPRRFPEIAGVGLMTYVRADDLPNFLAARQRDIPDFAVTPPGDRADYMLLTFIAPPNLIKVLGYNAGSSPERRAAMEEARDSGKVSFTHKVTIRTGGDMLAYLPIYAPDLPITTREERSAAIRGWAAIGFSMATLMEGIVKADDSTDLEIYDGAIAPENLLVATAAHRPSAVADAQKLETRIAIDMGGRHFPLVIASFGKPSRPFASTLIILGIGTCSGLLLLTLMRKIVLTLRQKEERLRLVLESSNDGFWDWDITSGTVFFSPQFSAMLGYRSGELQPIPESWENLVHPDDKPNIKGKLIDHFHGVTPRLDHEYRLRHRNGNWLWVRETAAVVMRAGQRATRMAGMVRDISERRKAGDRLRLMSTVVEQSPASVVITNSAGIIFYVNHMFETVTGYSYDEAFGQKPAIIASGLTPRHVYDELWATVTAGREWRGELCNRAKGGDLYWEEAVITQVRSSDGEIFYVGVKLDITARMRAKTTLLRSQKMEAIGTLAGGIAHDFNNILTSILGFNHLILGDIRDPDAVTRSVHQIHLAGNRAKDLVRQILTFSRQVPTQKSATDLCPVVNEVYQLIRTATPANIKVTLELPPGNAMVLATATQLHQVLMNLCVNAVDAIGGENGSIDVSLARRDGGFVLAVTDSGCGISPEVQSRIFDPFFTTKKTGMGSGLGLAVVHGIVEDLGGTISVENGVQGGARFVIGLPEVAAAPESRVAEPRPADSPPSRHSRHILVVDDDPAIIDLLRHFFERMGHRVSASTDSSEALGWIRQGESFDIVITDQMMPDVTGIELARTIVQSMPGTKVLLCSGRDDNIDYDDVAMAEIDGFILKPFNLIELADTVECLLERDAFKSTHPATEAVEAEAKQIGGLRPARDIQNG